MNELFNGLALKDAELLLASINLKTINLKNGEKLFLEGDICNKLAYITKGEVIAKQSFQDGHDCILKVINKNKFIGINLFVIFLISGFLFGPLTFHFHMVIGSMEFSVCSISGSFTT